MATSNKKEVHESLASLGGKLLVFGLVIWLGWIGYSAWSKNQPVKPTITARQQVAQQRQQAEPQKVVFTLNPGQGRVVKTGYKRVVWKTAGGQAMVRERDQAWYGEWKRDLPGRQTPFDFEAADAIEFWVPKNFPNPVTIVID